MLYTMVSEQPESQQSQASQCSVMASAQLPSCGLLAHNLQLLHTLLQVGKQFDALLIDVNAPNPSDPVFETYETDTIAVSA